MSNDEKTEKTDETARADDAPKTEVHRPAVVDQHTGSSYSAELVQKCFDELWNRPLADARHVHAIRVREARAKGAKGGDLVAWHGTSGHAREEAEKVMATINRARDKAAGEAAATEAAADADEEREKFATRDTSPAGKKRSAERPHFLDKARARAAAKGEKSRGVRPNPTAGGRGLAARLEAARKGKNR